MLSSLSWEPSGAAPPDPKPTAHFALHVGRGYQQYRPHACVRLLRSRREIPSLQIGEGEPRCFATRQFPLRVFSGAPSLQNSIAFGFRCPTTTARFSDRSVARLIQEATIS